MKTAHSVPSSSVIDVIHCDTTRQRRYPSASLADMLNLPFNVTGWRTKRCCLMLLLGTVPCIGLAYRSWLVTFWHKSNMVRFRKRCFQMRCDFWVKDLSDPHSSQTSNPLNGHFCALELYRTMAFVQIFWNLHLFAPLCFSPWRQSLYLLRLDSAVRYHDKMSTTSLAWEDKSYWRIAVNEQQDKCRGRHSLPMAESINRDHVYEHHWKFDHLMSHS